MSNTQNPRYWSRSLWWLGAVALLFLLPESIRAERSEQRTLDSEQAISAPSPVRQLFHRLLDGVERITLPNGLRILFYPRRQAPVFSAQIWVKVGGVNESLGATGAAHLLEHMAFKGTDKIGTKDHAKEQRLLSRMEELIDQLTRGENQVLREELKQIESELEQLSVRNEFSTIYEKAGAVGLNAGTSKDYTAYEVSLPNTAFELWCWMESERLVNPVLREFYQEREVVQEERRTRTDDSPSGKLYEAMVSTAYTEHPYRLPLIGYASDLKQLRKSDLEKLYQVYYRPDNMVVSLVGDLKREEIEPLLRRYFERIPKRTDPLPVIAAIEPPQTAERKVEVLFDAEPRVMLAFHKPVYPNKDDLHFAVFHSILSDGRSSVLYRELVQRRRLALSVGSSEAPGEIYPSLFYVSAVPAHGVKSEKLVAEIQSLLDHFKQHLVDSVDLEAAKKRVRADMLQSLASNSGLAAQLAHSELLWGRWNVMVEFYDTILSTSADDIKRLAESYLKQENRTTAILKTQTKPGK